MLVVGRRAIPLLLHYVAHTGSRELFRLAVLSVALGVAFAASQLFDVSFALGAFFAGMTLSESALSQVAAEESLPLRDAFAVLFFVSVGMLFDPMILVERSAADRRRADPGARRHAGDRLCRGARGSAARWMPRCWSRRRWRRSASSRSSWRISGSGSES